MSAPPRLADPVSCGEDLLFNLRRVLATAPRLCAGCADYHMRYAAHRSVGERFGVESDRPELVAVLRDGIEARLSGQGAVDIVIPGSADTGLLAIAAHAAATLGGEALARCRFTVLDICPTPLDLCRAFAEAHRLRLTCAEADLRAPARRFPADVMLLHSVFRFIPQAAQPAVLAELASWLKPGGRMVFSNRIKPDGGSESVHDVRKRQAANARFAERVKSGALPIDADLDTLLGYFERSVRDAEHHEGEFRDPQALRALLETAPLALRNFETLEWESRTEGAAPVMRRRVLAVLEAPQ